jgi:hypothetical protein
MYSLWSLLLGFLFAMILTGLTYPVWRISRSGRRAILDCTPSVSQLFSPLNGESHSAQRQKRRMEWISFKEFMTLLNKDSSDLIVINLRADASGGPFLTPTALVLPVTPHDLIRVLEWLPRNRSAVLCGASDFCISMIEKSACMEGSAPLYILELEDDFDHLEAA